MQSALASHEVTARGEEMPGSTRTAQDAANAVGCEVGQIAKSLVFATAEGELVLAITSGSNRVDTERLAELVGDSVGMANPDVVRETTGFAIGGVPPVGLAAPVTVFVDEDLLRHETIWAAAGTPRSVFAIEPRRLVEITGGQVADFVER